MAAWNRRHLNHQGATDVLAFDCLETASADAAAFAGLPGEDGDEAEPLLAGVIAVCPAVALRACARYGTTPEDELLLYLVHGMLHLAGQDDLNPRAKRRMRREERRVLTALRREGWRAGELFAVA